MLDINSIPLDDKKTWDLICSGNTKGVFQMESYLGKHWCKEIKPRSIPELADVSSVIRPGTLQARDENGKSMTQVYCDRKHGKEESTPLHPSIAHITNKTYQIIAFQEQILEISKYMAGFDGKQSTRLLKGLGKKDAAKLLGLEEEFVAGCVSQGHKEEDARKIFGIVKSSSRYAFNLSHATAYSKISYQTAYLKANYPLEFHVEWLRMAHEKIDPHEEVKELVESAKGMDIEVLPPKIQNGNADFEIIDGKIYFGITNIKNVGQNDFDNLVKEKFSTWMECLLALTNVNKRAVENMITVGVFSKFLKSRTAMLHEFSCINGDKTYLTKTELAEFRKAFDPDLSLLENLKRMNSPKKDGGICSTVKRVEAINNIIQRLENPGRSLSDHPTWIAIQEQRLLGTPLSCSKLDGCNDATFATTTCAELPGRKGRQILAAEITRIKTHTCKDGREMCFLTIEDESGKLESVVVFPDKYEEYSPIIYESAMVLLFGEYSKKSFIIDEVVQI